MKGRRYAPILTSVRRPGRANRSTFLGRWLSAWSLAALPAAAEGDFSLGVAVGDVRDRSAILWTRADQQSIVRIELATDGAFEALERTATALASAENDLVVKVELTGLMPATEYFYRFVVSSDEERVSRVGRFRTAPPPGQAAALRFVFSGDTGFRFAPLAVMSQAAREEADFLLWFGDTIFADDPDAASGIATTLEEYRSKYREIRSDPHVQEALATLPVWVGWDDHEVADNYAGADPELSREQLEAAYQAFFEYIPLEEQQIPGDRFRTYRRFRWGSQVEFFLLDGRQYREPGAQRACHSNPDQLGAILGPLLADDNCAQALSDERTLLGQQQFDWLTRGLLDSTAAVKIVANDVPLSYIGVLPYDRWDGYDAQRRALLEFIDANSISGVIFLTTDFHSNWYNPDVLRYFRDRRPDYNLSSQVSVVEAIVGPLGVATLHELAVEMATSTLGLPDGPVTLGMLTGVERLTTRRLQCTGGFTLSETNRVSFAVVEVSPSGEVEITYRGVEPADARDPDAAVETFYAARDDPPPPSLPCCLPILLVGLAGWPALVARQHRRTPSGETSAGVA